MVALVDCNNFYVSCERLFNAGLAGKPVVVLSNNDGCVIARSEEAKALGIRMGMPAWEGLAARGVELFSSNYVLYGSLSARVMKTLQSFSPAMEIYSIDEAFLELDGLGCPDLSVYGGQIRETVARNLGIPVTLGIAATKTLAKLSNRYAKIHCRSTGICYPESPGQVQGLLEATPVSGIWGIGRQQAGLLMKNGFGTAADLASAPDDWVRSQLSVTGLRIVQELRGIPCLPLEEVPPPKQAICVTRSFGKLLSARKDIGEAVASFTARCAEKLRSQQGCAGALQVFLHTSAHRQQDPQSFRSMTVRLPRPSSHTPLLIREALAALDRIFRPGYLFKKAGVMLLDLKSGKQVQQALFEGAPPEKGHLMGVLDSINGDFGRDTVKFGSMGYSGNWKLRQERRSPCYTTRLREVLTIKI
ncbi:MAG TPA: Y-family DNA polymerase [Chitinophagaceae bacterium]|nr:Y-family DNA polymerase [Chitinophagaceae bacterium]